MRWHDAKKNPPPVGGKFKDSEYLLCIERGLGSAPFVGWYNAVEDAWRVAHHSAPNIPRLVTHWRELPAPPKVV